MAHPLKRSLSIIGAVAAAAGVASWTYQTVGELRDRERHPPPGRLIDVDSSVQHVWVAGDGSPPVVVITCLGGPALEWARTQRRLQDRTMTVLYDRAGLGWSPSRGWSRTAEDMVDELHQLLDASDVDGPYVLVGHSIGGLVARLYATRYPEEVGGIVLVDASHEDMDERISEIDPPRRFRPRWGSALQIRLRWLGVRRLAYDLGFRPDVREAEERNVPADLTDAAVALALASRTRRGDAAEMTGLAASLLQVSAGARHLGDLPLTVITAGVGTGRGSRRTWYPVWLDLQADLVAQSSRARQIVAEHTGHHVHRDDPELVAAVIAEMIDEVRDTRS